MPHQKETLLFPVGIASRTAWWGMCEADPTATFFATPDWSDILTGTFRRFISRPVYFNLEVDTGMIIPAIEVRRSHPQLSTLHSMPFGTYGGVLSDGLVDPAHRDAAIRYFLSMPGARLQRTLYPNPLGDAVAAPLATHAGYVHVVDISGGASTLRDRLDRFARYEIRKAERRGVEVRCAMDEAAFEEFCKQHSRQAAVRDAPIRFPDRFYRSVWQHRSSRVELWGAYENSRMIAGVLVFRYQTQITPFFSFVLPESRPLAPTNLIYTRMLTRAIEDGFTHCNLSGSGGIASIERFKESMGAARRAFGYVNVTGPLYGLVHHPVVRKARRLAKNPLASGAANRYHGNRRSF